MATIDRSAWLVGLVAFALGCGGVTSPSDDAAADKGSGGNAGSGGTGGSAVCNVACTVGRTCCLGACVNTTNDPMNCGTCGKRCEGTTSLCSSGACVPATCVPGCTADQLCCESQGAIPGGAPTCFTPTADQKTCPQGCAPLCMSDRNQKKNIAPVDAAAILEKVGRLPISSWTYLKEPADVRHLGPMAQDFRASFGLGDDDRTYYAVDAQGVALAAIQALDHLVTTQEVRIQKLERENRDLARRLRTLDKR